MGQEVARVQQYYNKMNRREDARWWQERSQRLLRDASEHGITDREETMRLAPHPEELPQEDTSFLTSLFDTRNAAPVTMRAMDGQQQGLDWRMKKRLQERFLDFSPNSDRKSMHASRDSYFTDFELYLRENSHFQREEAGHFAELLLKPAISQEALAQRQAFFAELKTAENLPLIKAKKDAAYKLYSGLSAFGIKEVTHAGWIHDEGDETLAGLYHRGIEEVYYIDEDSYTTEKKLSVAKLMEDAYEQYATGLEALGDFIQMLKEIHGTMTTHALPELEEAYATALTFCTREFLFDLSDDPEDARKHERFWERVLGVAHDEILPTLERFGAIVEIASYLNKEQWAQVTFDPSLPDGYTQGWNIEHEKKEQVRNDSPLDKSLTVFSGANTSGKSYAMRSDFFVRLAAQSLGFAPVEQGNFHLYDSFSYLDRAATDANAGLSAFMKEVKNWKEALERSGKNARLYVDEGYSTTSPEGQALLLLATAVHVQEKDGSMVLATHNERVIHHLADNKDAGVYHFQFEIDQNGNLERSFKLTEGAEDSYALAVAKTRGFSPDVTQAAELYLAGSQSLLEGGQATYPEVKSYTEEEREDLKQQTISLRQIVPDDASRAAFHLFSSDPDFTPGRLLLRFIANKDAPNKKDPRGVSWGEVSPLISQMILYAPSATPEDILERQMLFTHLQQENAGVKISEATNPLLFAALSYELITAYDQEHGINKALNPLPLREGVKINRVRKSDIDSAIAFLKLNKTLLGDTFTYNPLLDDLEQIRSAHSALDNEDWKASGDLLNSAAPLLEQLTPVAESLPRVPFSEIDIAAITPELEVLLAHTNDREKEWIDSKLRWIREVEKADLLAAMRIVAGGLPLALLSVPEYEESFAALQSALYSIDSVHLHQAANNFERLFAGLKPTLQERTDATTVYADQPNLSFTLSRLGYKSQSDLMLEEILGDGQPTSPFTQELHRLNALAAFATLIQKHALTPVTFNATGALHLENGVSLAEEKDAQTPNTTSMGEGSEPMQLLTGPNGSGKTFYEKATLISLLTGLATGYAPAEAATMPLYQRVVYLDRVTQKHDSSLSAFATELSYWQELLDTVSSDAPAFVAVDEAFSTTSPTYQAAFTYGTIATLLRRSHHVLLATHNHEVIDRVTEESAAVRPYHFKFDVAGARVAYQYKKSPGHQESYAIDVANTLGLPEDIIKTARAMEH